MAPRRPTSISNPTTDTETGTDGDTAVERDLYALSVMHKRGLISDADYAARRAELMGPETEDGAPGAPD